MSIPRGSGRAIAAAIALADVSGRTVVLFVARENGRMAVLGMHD